MEGSLQAPPKLQMHVCFDPAILHRGIYSGVIQDFYCSIICNSKKIGNYINAYE